MAFSLGRTSWNLVKMGGEVKIQVWDDFNFEEASRGIPGEPATTFGRWSNLTNFRILLDPVPLGEAFPSFYQKKK